MRIQNQVRTDFGYVTGWDFGAALSMGEALGIESAAIGEFLPHIEAEMVNGLAARREASTESTET